MHPLARCFIEIQRLRLIKVSGPRLASPGAPRRVPQCLLTTLVHILLFQSCYLWFTNNVHQPQLIKNPNNWESPYSLSILVQCFLKSEESWLWALDSNSHMAHFDGFVSNNISLCKCEHYSQYIYRWLLEILKQFKRSILNYRVIQKHIKNIVIFGGKQNISWYNILILEKDSTMLRLVFNDTLEFLLACIQ